MIIEEIITVIDSKITALQKAREAIQAVFGSEAPIVSKTEHLKTYARANNAGVSVVKPIRRKTNGNGSPARLTREQGLALLAGLPQPIEIKSITAKTSLTKNGASSMLTRFMRDGLIKRIGFGQYELIAKSRTAAVSREGGTSRSSTPLDSSKPAAPSKFTRAELETKLANALKQRDHARENGRDQMVDIFQQDVDAIEAKLAALQ